MLYDEPPYYWDKSSEEEWIAESSRDNNRLLWELYDSLIDDAEKQKIPVEWVNNQTLDSVVIGNYEVSQGTFPCAGVDMKCLDIIPHAGEYDLSRFRLYFEDVDLAVGFFLSHFTALLAERKAVAVNN